MCWYFTTSYFLITTDKNKRSKNAGNIYSRFKTKLLYLNRTNTFYPLRKNTWLFWFWKRESHKKNFNLFLSNKSMFSEWKRDLALTKVTVSIRFLVNGDLKNPVHVFTKFFVFFHKRCLKNDCYLLQLNPACNRLYR